jgi:predicted transglutaminase-like cysteine proteinase
MVMNTKYVVFALGCALFAGLMRVAVTSTTRLDAGAPAEAPFAHTRFCLRYPNDCKEQNKKDTVKSIPLTHGRRAQLNDINSQVNRSIAAHNQYQSPATENWIINPAAGDCNDYVVTKRHELMSKGWPMDSLLMAEVVLPSGEHHLVLIARTSEGDLVLDNLKTKVRTLAEARMDYKWVRIESDRNPKFWNKVLEPS